MLLAAMPMCTMAVPDDNLLQEEQSLHYMGIGKSSSH
jgi:hypothetical protein